MQSTSPVWKGLLASGAALQARATIGGTVYTDISAPVIDRATMSGSLAVGNVVSASLALAVRGAVNLPRSAAVIVEVRLNDGETASEWLPQGTFYISRRARDPVTGLLALECYDALLKANAVWAPSAGAWPRTMATVTAELAALLGVALDSRTVIPTGAAYAMSEPAEGTTIRDALSLVGQAAGGNWIMTPAGKLRLVRLGEAGDTVDVAGVVGSIDVGRAGTITGVRSTVDGVATLTGDDIGIVVDVTLAPVIAVELAEALIGQAWQPFRLDGAVYDPAAELGDAVNAGANGEVAATLCSEQAAYSPAFRGSIAAPDPGEVTDEYPYLGSAERTLALAKAAANRAVERYDDNLTQQEIFNRLTDNGAAQGMILYGGQLYINASYINAGRMNVGRVDFNEPDSYYDVPDENDPDSLLSGQSVVDGWIVNSSGSGNITVFSCGFAIPLRGKTVTVTFAFDGNLKGGENFRTLINDKAQTMNASQYWEMPSGQTPSNPYTYSVTVPDDAMSFSIAMECAGVKQIEVSLDSPITPSESIVYNYEGQRIGEGRPFRVYRDGTLITRGKSIFDGPTRINTLYLVFPLDVASGGTGAYNAAGARSNLGITPANIGAKPTQTAVADPTASGTAVAFIDSITQNANGVITPTKKTVRSASQSESGLMSAADKKKLDGIAAGAQVNSITGVKGNAESSYRTGNVNLTPANIAFIGTNPTGGTSNDTREWWVSKGTCYAFFGATNQVNGQPNQYGFLISIVYGAEVHQEWWTQPNGAHYYRGGNANTSAMPGWTENVTGVKGNAESSYRTGNVNLTPANIGAKPTQTAVADPTASGTAVAFIDSIAQNANGVITPTKKTVRSASQSESGLMSATDKKKLDGIAAGAQVNSLTGVKGNAESSYRTGNVNLTPANISALYTAHLNGANLDNIVYNFLGTVWNFTGTGVSAFGSQCGTLICTDVDSFGTSGSRVRQVFMNFFGNDIWTRTRNDTTWSAWKCLAQNNANVGASISLTSTDTTAALLYNKLKGLELNYPASIRVTNESIQKLTGKSISGGYGTVVNTGVESGTLVLSFDICYVAGNYRHAFTTRVSQNTITPGAVYRYTGTAVS